MYIVVVFKGYGERCRTRMQVTTALKVFQLWKLSLGKATKS